MNYKISMLIVGIALCFMHETMAQELEKRIRINGYTSFEYEQRLTGTEGSDPNRSFDADLMDIVINVDITPKLRFATDVTWEHGAASEDGRGNVAVEYYFPEYTVRNWLKFRAGKMFVPFGIYNEIHTAKPAFMAVKEPNSTNKPDKLGADLRFYPRWATGLSVLGNFSISSVNLEYHVQLSNGDQLDESGANPFEEDDNGSKALAVRLLIQPTNDLKFGISMYNDNMTLYDDNGDDTGAKIEVRTLGMQAEYTLGNFGLELEYVSGNNTETGNASVKKHAVEAMLYYTFLEQLTPYIRYEYLDPDKNIASNEAKVFSVGVNTRVVKQFFVKLQYNATNTGVINGEYAGSNFTDFQAAIVLGF